MGIETTNPEEREYHFQQLLIKARDAEYWRLKCLELEKKIKELQNDILSLRKATD